MMEDSKKSAIAVYVIELLTSVISFVVLLNAEVMSEELAVI